MIFPNLYKLLGLPYKVSESEICIALAGLYKKKADKRFIESVRKILLDADQRVKYDGKLCELGLATPRDFITNAMPEAINVRQKQNNPILDLYSSFVAVDIETTGLSPDTDEIVELSAIKFVNGVVVDKFTSLAKPSKRIPERVIAIHGIDNDMVKSSPPPIEVVKKFWSFVGNEPIVAHNAKFDMSFIHNSYIHASEFISRGSIVRSHPVFDTLPLSRYMFPDLYNHKLGTIKDYLGIESVSHRAESDAIAAGKVFYATKNVMDNCRQNIDFLNKSDENLHNSIIEILSEYGINTDYILHKNAGRGLRSTSFYYPIYRYQVSSKNKYVLTNSSRIFLKEWGETVRNSLRSQHEENKVILRSDYNFFYAIPYDVIAAYWRANGYVKNQLKMTATDFLIQFYSYLKFDNSGDAVADGHIEKPANSKELEEE
ncbi:exonuclease domain-containing protein [Snodgrassella communis]|jgi:DNA polymerase III epsilon subunit family exonuclease|uniref:exonuclease domain-containing protein n=1 Tax=Snodgrassella communis TaxID=2946699 RepID=UPI000C1E6238|nr:exonuclease domain-containing protein [Snodgrassella communis]PIT19897.1 hypothetical protein BGI35_09415 [Snodgrassella communis]